MPGAGAADDSTNDSTHGYTHEALSLYARDPTQYTPGPLHAPVTAPPHPISLCRSAKRSLPDSPPPRVQRTIQSSKKKNTVRTGVFVGHAVRYPINSVPPPLLSCPTPGKTPPPPPPPPWGTVLPPYTHIFRHRICTAKQQITASCLHAHKRCGDMHHRALNIQRPAPKQVPLWSG